MSEASLSLEEIASKLNHALGKEGTRLCMIDKIEQDGDRIKVYTSETVCSSGEPQGSDRKCTYTLGAVWGALGQIFGKRLRGTHTEFSFCEAVAMMFLSLWKCLLFNSHFRLHLRSDTAQTESCSILLRRSPRN